MKHPFFMAFGIGCIGAFSMPVGCSGSGGDPAGVPGAAEQQAAPVGEAQEAQHGASCTHDTCTIGGQLGDTCNACTEQVCSPFIAPYCCELTWDANCVTLANGYCGVQGTQTCSCTHDLCTVGTALDSGCSACTARVCASMPSCCTAGSEWSANCVGLAEMFCGETCTPPCAHSPCNTGGPLSPSCDPCVETVCAGGPFGDRSCCTSAWDAACVLRVSACEACGAE